MHALEEPYCMACFAKLKLKLKLKHHLLDLFFQQIYLQLFGILIVHYIHKGQGDSQIDLKSRWHESHPGERLTLNIIYAYSYDVFYFCSYFMANIKM